MGANYVNGMHVSSTYRADPLFEALGDEFSDIVAPASFPQHKLRWRNQTWARAVGLAELSDAEWEAAFAKFAPLPGNMQAPRAMRYHGHQFQSYNPQIGDGLDGLGAALAAMAESGVTMVYTSTPLVVAQGNFVFTGSEGTFGGKPTAFFDLFRVEGGKIVEHWDVIAEIPAKMAHDNGKF
jgi:predicted SnoaL-like aldol condensation-catalyzing enzyme